ncbi:MAG TPA: SET domain-containing protein [Niabella sp.]|nr:SET domain-containing protein [Niabella sp.]
MCLPAKHLKVKTSTIPQSGKGLFVAVDVPRGAMITEYVGRRATWADVEDDADNPYIYYIDDDNVIDASNDLKSFGRYANDAAGLTRVPGLKNNAEYEEEGHRVFIKAKAPIAAGSEVFVAYGKDYWKQVRENIKIDVARKKKAAK